MLDVAQEVVPSAALGSTAVPGAAQCYAKKKKKAAVQLLMQMLCVNDRPPPPDNSCNKGVCRTAFIHAEPFRLKRKRLQSKYLIIAQQTQASKHSKQQSRAADQSISQPRKEISSEEACET